MAFTAPILNDYQMWFEGLTFGASTDIGITSLNGVEGLMVRSGDKPFPREHGAIPGLHLAQPKNIIAKLEPIDDGIDDLKEFFLVLKEAQGELHYKFPGVAQKFVRARILRRPDLRTAFTENLRPATVVWTAADPRSYTKTESSEGLDIYTVVGGGLEWDIDWDVDYAAGSALETVAINDGTVNAYPIFRFYGPVSGTVLTVQITNTTTGQVLDIDKQILVNQILKADMDALVRASGDPVIAIGATEFYDSWQLPREPFYLAPGMNTLRFETTGTATVAVCTISWRDTEL